MSFCWSPNVGELAGGEKEDVANPAPELLSLRQTCN